MSGRCSIALLQVHLTALAILYTRRLVVFGFNPVRLGHFAVPLHRTEVD